MVIIGYGNHIGSVLVIRQVEVIFTHGQEILRIENNVLLDICSWTDSGVKLYLFSMYICDCFIDIVTPYLSHGLRF